MVYKHQDTLATTRKFTELISVQPVSLTNVCDYDTIVIRIYSQQIRSPIIFYISCLTERFIT